MSDYYYTIEIHGLDYQKTQQAKSAIKKLIQEANNPELENSIIFKIYATCDENDVNSCEDWQDNKLGLIRIYSNNHNRIGKLARLIEPIGLRIEMIVLWGAINGKGKQIEKKEGTNALG